MLFCFIILINYAHRDWLTPLTKAQRNRPRSGRNDVAFTLHKSSALCELLTDEQETVLTSRLYTPGGCFSGAEFMRIIKQNIDMDRLEVQKFIN